MSSYSRYINSHFPTDSPDIYCKVTRYTRKGGNETVYYVRTKTFRCVTIENGLEIGLVRDGPLISDKFETIVMKTNDDGKMVVENWRTRVEFQPVETSTDETSGMYDDDSDDSDVE